MLIICDDIYNVDGDIPVVRTPPDFCIIHLHLAVGIRVRHFGRHHG